MAFVIFRVSGLSGFLASPRLGLRSLVIFVIFVISFSVMGALV